MSKEREDEWRPGENTHENIIYACFGGLSNTGVTAALAAMEVVKELGLKKVAWVSWWTTNKCESSV